MRFQVAASVLLVLSAVLAGCSGGSKDKAPADDTPALQVTETTGGVRGLVVDQAVVPVQGAKIVISGGANATSGKDGMFNFTGLEAGDYILSVTKPGFVAVQATASVVAGVAAPPIVKVLLERISSAQPYLDHFKLEGFYECTTAINVDTDTCDWVYRTGWDQYNESQGSPPPVAPRSFFHYYNTQYIDVPMDTFSIVQEGFWTDESVHTLWVMVDKTPIDAACDCSDTYSNVIGGSPTYNRMDRFTATGENNTEFKADFVNGDQVGTFPAGERVAARGFIPFQDTPVVDGTDPNAWYSVGQNFQFTIITSLFHNYVAPDGWTFETKDQYKVG